MGRNWRCRESLDRVKEQKVHPGETRVGWHEGSHDSELFLVSVSFIFTNLKETWEDFYMRVLRGSAGGLSLQDDASTGPSYWKCLKFLWEVHRQGFGNCFVHVFWDPVFNRSCLLPQQSYPHPNLSHVDISINSLHSSLSEIREV